MLLSHPCCSTFLLQQNKIGPPNSPKFSASLKNKEKEKSLSFPINLVLHSRLLSPSLRSKIESVSLRTCIMDVKKKSREKYSTSVRSVFPLPCDVLHIVQWRYCQLEQITAWGDNISLVDRKYLLWEKSSSPSAVTDIGIDDCCMPDCEMHKWKRMDWWIDGFVLWCSVTHPGNIKRHSYSAQFWLAHAGTSSGIVLGLLLRCTLIGSAGIFLILLNNVHLIVGKQNYDQDSNSTVQS